MAACNSFQNSPSLSWTFILYRVIMNVWYQEGSWGADHSLHWLDFIFLCSSHHGVLNLLSGLSYKVLFVLTIHLTGCQNWTRRVHQPVADWAQVISAALLGALSQGGLLAWYLLYPPSINCEAASHTGWGSASFKCITYPDGKTSLKTDLLNF